ncbi:hypothetical protein HQ533_01790 [Candidatus Woesearchaeota archaeon]|nr:hypothetical protein [Candidatus Woesearchaeota archaeon]
MPSLRTITDELIMFDKNFHKSGQNAKDTGYWRSDLEILSRKLKYLIRKKIIQPGDTFLDLGSGLGLPDVLAAHFGLNSYGIEINSVLQQSSEILIEVARNHNFIPPEVTCKTTNGSYYPNEYMDLRESGETVAQKYEMITVPPSWHNVSNKKYFENGHVYVKRDTEEAYKELGLDFSEVDVFYSYIWPPQLPSILEIFSLYSKDDATMINICPWAPINPKGLLNELNLDYQRVGSIGDRLFEHKKAFDVAKITKKRKPILNRNWLSLGQTSNQWAAFRFFYNTLKADGF